MSPPPTIQPASSFTPRKEFLRTPKHTRNSFALLALSGPNCVRLRSFSTHTVHSVRRVLEQYAPILAVREDDPNSLCEFTIDKKPWANPRSVPSEKLLVDILGAIYQAGYTYLSTMDYGREADDRLDMVFSKMEPVAPLVSKSTTHHPTLVSRNESSTSSLVESLPIRRVPFAISFSSMTVMRVVSPPLHLTPAILQACRGAWPRGVISEKTVYENSYEFKLKGYGLFEQDTFAVDSLQHIFALLSALDAQSLSLIASISLTGHSRIKDLWLFTAPAPEDKPSELLELPTSEASALRRFSFPPGQVDPQHKRQTTELSHSPLAGHHNKSSSESPQRRALPTTQQTNVLRKASPRAQVPIDVRNSEIFHQGADIPSRTHLPSVISSGAIDMTGVGSGQTPDVFYETSSFSPGTAQQNHIVASVPVSGSSTPPHSPGRSGRVETPPLLMSSHSTGSKHPPQQREPVMASPVVESNTTTPAPLLGSMAFRDSSMTSDTELTREIPIKWTGPLNEELDKVDKTKARESRVAETHVIPGGWSPRPIAEQAESDSEQTDASKTPILQNESRVEAPEVIQPDVELRKSEAALVGIIKSTTPPVSAPQNKEKDRSAPAASGSNGKGWVLVNVEDSPPNGLNPTGGSESQGSPAEIPGASGTGQDLQPKPATAEAKAIVVIDVLSSKKRIPNTSTTASKEGDSSVKRLFSLGRKNSKKSKAE